MQKSDNPCRKHPNTARILQKRFYSKRKELELSQEALAYRMGLTRNCIQQMECFEHMPQFLTFLELLEALEFSEEEGHNFISEVRHAYRRDKTLPAKEKA